jgi:ABC-type microcin C transport system permease subunit YejB
MKQKLFAWLFFAAALVALVLGVATLVAMSRSLTVSTTLAAIESAFGSFVLAIILLVAARKLFDAGLKRLKTDTWVEPVEENKTVAKAE